LSSKVSILIVDDHKNICKTLSLVFKKKGYETTSVGTGKEALAITQKEFFNLAFINIKLPDMDGIELLTLIDNFYPDLAVFMIASFASLETAMQAMNMGASSYFVKPLDLDDVVNQVEKTLLRQSLLFKQKNELQKVSILIVDDDASIQKSLSLILRKKGFETETVSTAQEALKKAEGRFFNITLLDIRLPDKDGIEILEPILKLMPDSIVMMITAHASLDTAIEAMNMGATAYITKPLDIDDVILTINEALEKQRLVLKIKRLSESLKLELADRIEIERKLRESRETFRSFINSSTQTFSIWDSKLNLIDCNEAFHKDFFPNEKREDIIGKNILNLTPDTKKSGIYDRYIEVIKTGNPTRIDDFVSSSKFGKKHLSITAFKVGNGLGLIIDDITKRWEDEITMRESEEKFSKFFSTIPDAAFVIDQDTGDIIEVNEAAVKIYGYSRDEWLKMKNTDVSVESEKTSIATKTPSAHIPIRYHKKKDGTVFPLEMNIGLYKMKGRNIVFATGRDISERLKIKEELQKQKDELESFTGTVSHDLKGRMAILMALADLEETEYSEMMINQIEDLSKLVENLLLLAMEGEILGELSAVNLNELLEKIAKNISTVDPDLKIIIQDLPILNSDPTKLTQVFENILMNVLRHAKASQVEIFAKENKNEHIIHVRDNGIGITKEKLAEIRESWKTRKYKSIGMLIVLKIVEAHNGRLILTSKKGKGTTVSVHFLKK